MNWLIITMIISIFALVVFGFLYLYLKLFVWLIDYYCKEQSNEV